MFKEGIWYRPGVCMLGYYARPDGWSQMTPNIVIKRAARTIVRLSTIVLDHKCIIPIVNAWSLGGEVAGWVRSAKAESRNRTPLREETVESSPSSSPTTTRQVRFLKVCGETLSVGAKGGHRWNERHLGRFGEAGGVGWMARTLDDRTAR